ncbi:maleylacetoacetate isomerase [Roseibium litorale]|uniref:Maleylacetoacetate isomerase n=1 Tax=Roseibium litorale TaxID=2803841 RepID=A0ABR9CLL5_9HYPH|nr:maleylacetoacetate isomerase [Roseibium litorale]MBD8891736.1 maleylacetoacetate isomerase [Roseibium litorale]
MIPVLHSYFRSSTSFRLRAALNLKGIETEYRAHHLRLGEQRSPAYLKLNPQGLVPALELPDGTVLTQSMAIIEYLDETVPEPPLLPEEPVARAQARAMAQMIACEIHPVNNLKILTYLKTEFGAGEEAVAVWFRHWVAETFAPLENLLANRPVAHAYCCGDTPGLADICLVAQVTNNKRFAVDMTPYPVISAIYERCMELPAFQKAAPANQPDAE